VKSQDRGDSPGTKRRLFQFNAIDDCTRRTCWPHSFSRVSVLRAVARGRPTSRSLQPFSLRVPSEKAAETSGRDKYGRHAAALHSCKYRRLQALDLNPPKSRSASAGRPAYPQTHADEQLRVATALFVHSSIRASISAYPSRSAIWRKCSRLPSRVSRRLAARLLLESPSIAGDCESDDRIRRVGDTRGFAAH
jgi:hypothetical protein